jgi:RNA polymerase sigma-70 factor (ECF subfamily)
MPDTTANPLPLPFNKLPLVAASSAGSAPPPAIVVLTRRLAAGDEEAFREFHQLYFDRLYRFLLAVTRGQDEAARDALQETLLRVLRRPRVFHDEEVFWCWLKAVARNIARDGSRKHRRYFALLERFALWRQAGRLEFTGGDEQNLGALLQESLEELEAGERRLIEHKYLDGQSVRELSQLTGTTEKAVESRLLRLRRHLRRRILEKLKSL